MAQVTELDRRPPRYAVRLALGLLAALVLAAGGWATTAWLFTEADRASGDGRVAARLDAARTGLAVAGGGTAVALALLALARRRPAPPDPSPPAASPAAEDGRQVVLLQDMTERRITELYLRAAERLGGHKAPVRMAALYTLERLAAEHPPYRQTIVDIICAYLRMPYDPEGAQERQVRTTAQRILSRHLRAAVVGAGGDEGPNPQRWADLALDLAGATLIDLDFQRCQLGQANFTGATFLGRTSFQQAEFQLAAWFGEATFHGLAEFHDVTFQRGAWFREATFQGNAGFGKAVFAGAGDAVFERATFAGYADFGGIAAHSNAAFLHARFCRGANFRDATFYGTTHFSGATVDGRSDLERALFNRASFYAGAYFGAVSFQADVVFDDARFLAGADFTGGTIAGSARFDNVAAVPDTAALGLAQVSVIASRNGHVWPSGWRSVARPEGGTATLTYGVARDQPSRPDATTQERPAEERPAEEQPASEEPTAESEQGVNEPRGPGATA